MNKLSVGVLAGVAGLLTLFGQGTARADILIEKNVRVSMPSVPTSNALNLTSAGILTVTVSDLLWPQALQTLSFAISDHDSVLKTATGTGSLMFDIVTPGTYFANVYAAPSLLSGVGMYHLNVSFMPTVVPLPAAVWLLVSGIFGLTHLVRRRGRNQRAAPVSGEPMPENAFNADRPRVSARARDRLFADQALGASESRPRRLRRKNRPAARPFVTSPIVQ